ncbi:MAG: cupin domain-containing protein [Ectothiorhodospiraceae bacterium]|nr:cupin domain-containing protein [Ectothiorhodospiraceae bacterium]MCH8503026.1 AraC family ligand binding domain-containing protein [Ectothiorhodospiraceae bacterium]
MDRRARPRETIGLGGLTPEVFLRDYWQQQPLLIRQAWPGFQPPLSPEELAGLALEPDIESRLIRQTDTGWSLRHGPFETAHFQRLPKSCWTLLVQDVEKWLPSLQTILDRFDFLPRWRRDDLMVSYAAPGGSVGAHVDRYDVFLLQGQGQRRWQIDRRPNAPLEEDPDAPLRLLRDFHPSDDWLLEPGDMLYLPPGIPHLGVAETACMTFSIGFRAATLDALLVEATQLLQDDGEHTALFADIGRGASPHPALLDESSLSRARGWLREALTDSLLDRAFGRVVTQTKPGFDLCGPDTTIDRTTLSDALDSVVTIRRHPALRVALRPAPSGGGVCFLDGDEWPLDENGYAFMEQLTSGGDLTPQALSALLRNEAHWTLMLELLQAGYWEIDDDDG